MISKITDSVIYVGANDHEVDLFEGQYVVPNGMAYNSYVILDDKTAVMDTIDRRKTDEWMSNVEKALDGRKPDYLIVQHMEPDHSASIGAFVEKYRDVTVVGNKKTFNMIRQFFPSHGDEEHTYRGKRRCSGAGSSYPELRIRADGTLAGGNDDV